MPIVHKAILCLKIIFYNQSIVNLLKDTDPSKWGKSNLHYIMGRQYLSVSTQQKCKKKSAGFFQVCTNRDEFNCFRIEPTTIAALY